MMGRLGRFVYSCYSPTPQSLFQRNEIKAVVFPVLKSSDFVFLTFYKNAINSINQLVPHPWTLIIGLVLLVNVCQALIMRVSDMRRWDPGNVREGFELLTVFEIDKMGSPVKRCNEDIGLISHPLITFLLQIGQI